MEFFYSPSWSSWGKQGVRERPPGQGPLSAQAGLYVYPCSIQRMVFSLSPGIDKIGKWYICICLDTVVLPCACLMDTNTHTYRNTPLSTHTTHTQHTHTTHTRAHTHVHAPAWLRYIWFVQSGLFIIKISLRWLAFLPSLPQACVGCGVILESSSS